MSKQLSLATLRNNAARSTSKRGHRMRWGNPYGHPPVPHLGDPLENYGQTGTCIYCGKEVQIKQRPAPNEIGIGGEAVALNCTRA